MKKFKGKAVADFDVASRTIYKVVHGSRAFGLATPTSDLDIKGVCIEPTALHFGFRRHFEQEEQLAADGFPADSVIYSLKKFAKLAAECNPSIIEVLFVEDSDVLVMDEFGKELRAMRDFFISKKARFTFAGYAKSQLEKMLLHRHFYTDGAPERPTRAEFGLPEKTVIPKDQLAAAQAAITKKLARWNLGDMTELDPAMRIVLTAVMAESLAEMAVASDASYKAAGRTIGYSENFLELLDRERKYNARMERCRHYDRWLAERNPARAELERKVGFDSKHGSHLIRLQTMCLEILQGKGVIVKRPDAQKLLGIKLRGEMGFEGIVEHARDLDKQCAEAYEKSTLPEEPNYEAIDAWVVATTQEYLRRSP